MKINLRPTMRRHYKTPTAWTMLCSCIFLLSLASGCHTKTDPTEKTANLYRQDSPKPLIQASEMKVDFQLGDTNFHAFVHQKRSPSPTMINVHDDENTSVEAGKVSLNTDGGRIIELVHTGDRLITFRLNGQNYKFDPNRIFSDAGITATLKKHSTYTEAAHAEIKKFATQYLNRFAFDREPFIIALHNTSDTIFSVLTFAPGGTAADDASQVHVNPNRSKYDFFYVTDQRFYDYLKAKDFNVVLQNNNQVTDDGSLSVYFSQKNIPYINVEADVHHLDNQIEMVKVMRVMLRELGFEK